MVVVVYGVGQLRWRSVTAYAGGTLSDRQPQSIGDLVKKYDVRHEPSAADAAAVTAGFDETMEAGFNPSNPIDVGSSILADEYQLTAIAVRIGERAAPIALSVAGDLEKCSPESLS